MGNVQFSDEAQPQSRFTSRSVLGEPEVPAMVRFILKLGFVKSERIAGYVLTAIIAVAIILSVAFFVYMSMSNSKKVPMNVAPSVLNRLQNAR